MNDAYEVRNDLALTRLRQLVQRLTASDLDRPLGGNWTVKAALMHLAFWDRFVLAAIQQWGSSGYLRSGNDDAFINSAGLRDWLAADPAYVFREVIRSAERTDEAAASIGGALRTELHVAGEVWVYERGIHRTEHIDQIEAASGR